MLLEKLLQFEILEMNQFSHKTLYLPLLHERSSRVKSLGDCMDKDEVEC